MGETQQMPNKAESLPLTSERVDDLPLRLAQLQEMRVPELLKESCPPHGNWRGLSLGHLVTVWLTFSLSESTPRVSHLRAWTAARLLTVQAGLGGPRVATDVTDDRLAQALDYLSDPMGWSHFEDVLNRQTLRSYDLAPPLVRLDRTTAKSDGHVMEEGLVPCGHRKDQRPDLPQLKLKVSTLEPLGLPRTATITSGEKADEPFDVPESDRGRQTLQRRGLRYVGDSKMTARIEQGHALPCRGITSLGFVVFVTVTA